MVTVLVEAARTSLRWAGSFLAVLALLHCEPTPAASPSGVVAPPEPRPATRANLPEEPRGDARAPAPLFIDVPVLEHAACTLRNKQPTSIRLAAAGVTFGVAQGTLADVVVSLKPDGVSGTAQVTMKDLTLRGEVDGSSFLVTSGTVDGWLIGRELTVTSVGNGDVRARAPLPDPVRVAATGEQAVERTFRCDELELYPTFDPKSRPDTRGSVTALATATPIPLSAKPGDVPVATLLVPTGSQWTARRLEQRGALAKVRFPAIALLGNGVEGWIPVSALRPAPKPDYVILAAVGGPLAPALPSAITPQPPRTAPAPPTKGPSKAAAAAAPPHSSSVSAPPVPPRGARCPDETPIYVGISEKAYRIGSYRAGAPIVTLEVPSPGLLLVSVELAGFVRVRSAVASVTPPFVFTSDLERCSKP